MKKLLIYFQICLWCAVLISGCGGSGGSDSSGTSGTVSMNVTDARPALPPGTESVLITFDEVSVHKSGGGWSSLTLTPDHTIDLLQFYDGTTTQLVPPVSLESGKYTQVRIGVSGAVIRIGGQDYNLEIPSEYLKTDKNFEFTVSGGGAVDLTVDFDLSQSIIVTGTHQYRLRPVLHLNQTQEAATIQGKISSLSFGSETEAEVLVTVDEDNSGSVNDSEEEYTLGTVTKGADPTEFTIFWLVPDQSYVVQVRVGGLTVYEEAIPAASLPASAIYSLHTNTAI